MNIFSNIGITELIVILVLALLVVGPERLPELARSLAKVLRDIRKAYENLTRDLGPEIMSFQQTTQELRESVQSVRTIPQDVVKSVVKAADLDDTISELKEAAGSVEQVGRTISDARKVIKSPVSSAVSAARDSLRPAASTEDADTEAGKAADETTARDPLRPAASTEDADAEAGKAADETTAPESTPEEQAHE